MLRSLQSVTIEGVSMIDPISGIILIVAVGVFGVAAGVLFAAAVQFFFGGIFLLLVAFVFIGVGLVGDWIYDRRVTAGKAPFRLPFYYRWKGWKIGTLMSGEMTTGFRLGMYHDKKHNRIIHIHRPVFDYERYEWLSSR